MDKREFKNAEIVDCHPSERAVRNYGDAREWIGSVAREGRDGPAFVTTGWWQKGHGGERSAKCAFPWLYFDIDFSEDLMKGLDIAEAVSEDLLQEGFHEDYTFISFSGKKGWHVRTSTGTLGMPFFRTSRHALETWKSYLHGMIERYSLDASVCTPLGVIRLTGSRHGDTGNRKWTMRAADVKTHKEGAREMVRQFSGDTLLTMEQVRSSRLLASEFPDPFGAPTVPAAARQFAEEWETAMEAREGGGDRPEADGQVLMPDPTYRAFQGLGKSDKFGTGLYGREMGAFCLACHFFRAGHSAERVLDLLRKWDRQRNDPPLQEDPGELPYVLEEKVNSAASQCYHAGEIDEYKSVEYWD